MTMPANPFQKATRAQLKARVAFEGPTGAGKTWTGLEWASVLADGQPIAVVDTERGSASLYSDKFDFDVLTFEPPYEPGRLADVLKAAEAHGYAVVVVDSLSHFWEGEGGTLDMVDAAAQRSGGNQFAGWKVGTPALRHLVDTMLGLNAHLIATMRSKMEYVLQEDNRGKKVPQKVGMAPVMRAGVEYEFTLVGDLDLEHRLTITKSRCDRLADEMVQPGRAADAAKVFLGWLGEGEALIEVAVADGLTARLNEAGPEARKAWRSHFGLTPRQLRETQTAEAMAFVEEIEAGSASPGGGEGAPAPEVEEAAPDGDVQPEGVNGPSTEDTPPAPPEPDGQDTEGAADQTESAAPGDWDDLNRFQWAILADIWPGEDQDELDARRQALIDFVSDGATRSSKDLTADQVAEYRHALHALKDGTWECELVKARSGQGLGWDVVLTGAAVAEPGTAPVEDEQLPYLRELIAQVPGLGEARAFTRAKGIAKELDEPVPASFEALTGRVLDRLLVEVSKKIADLAKEAKEEAAA